MANYNGIVKCGNMELKLPRKQRKVLKKVREESIFRYNFTWRHGGNFQYSLSIVLVQRKRQQKPNKSTFFLMPVSFFLKLNCKLL